MTANGRDGHGTSGRSGAPRRRVWELARLLRTDNRDVINRLADLGVDVHSASASVDADVAERLLVAPPRSAPSPPDPVRAAIPVTRRIAHVLRPRWRGLSAILAIDLLAAPLLLLSALPLKVAIDSVIGDRPLPGFVDPFVPDSLTTTPSRLLLVVVVLQIGVVLLAELQYLLSYVVRTQVGERITLDIQTRLFRHVQRLSILFHDERGTADSLFRVQYDAPAFRYVTVDGFLPLVTSAATLIVTLVVIMRIDVGLALVALAICPVLYILASAYNTRMRPRYKDAHGMESAAFQVVQEALSALRVVKAFGREDREHERFLQEYGRGMAARIRLAAAEGAFGLLVNLTTAVGSAAVLYIGVRHVLDGSLTLGELVLVIAYLTQLYAPLRTISHSVASVQSSLASAERVFDLLDEPEDVVQRPNARRLARARGDVEFRDMSFGYEPGRMVHHRLSFSVPAGTRLGVAGRTGAGKTTLVALLCRFFDPVSGRVLIDGVDARDWHLADLRNQFSFVPQDPVLFSTSIAENIAYARPEATADEIVAAAKAANAHEFIAAFPDGYDTVVGERGMRLSGGERQRVALARAFLKDAPILVLDEPTSAVDALTERTIIEAMDRLMAGRTTFLITHRPTTLAMCDAVLELEGGRVKSFAPVPGRSRRRSRPPTKRKGIPAPR